MPGFNIGSGNPLSANPLAESHRTHRWRIIKLINDIVFVNDNIFDTLMYAKDLTLPKINFDVLEVEGGSLKYKYATYATFDDVTLIFYDVYGLLKPLTQLVNSVWDENAGIKPASLYKGTCEFALCNGAGNDLVNVVLNNAWIKSLGHSQLSYTTSDIKTIELTIAYDWMIITDKSSTTLTSAISSTASRILSTIV